MVAHNERRLRGPVALLHIRKLNDPAHFPVLGIQRNQVRIRRNEEDPVLIHANTALADMVPFIRWIGVVPEHVTGPGIDGPHIVRHGKVQNTVDQQRSRFNFRRLAGLKSPGEA